MPHAYDMKSSRTKWKLYITRGATCDVLLPASPYPQDPPGPPGAAHPLFHGLAELTVPEQPQLFTTCEAPGAVEIGRLLARGGSRLVGRGSQSFVVICRSTYEPGRGVTHVSFYLQKG